jgi:integrase
LTADGLDEILSGARSRAGLAHATCHELRHTCFTRLRESGMALEAIQAQAGHVSIETTRVYLNPRELHQTGERNPFLRQLAV